MEFNSSLLCNIKGSLITIVISLLLLIIGNILVYTALAEEPVEQLYQLGPMVFANREALIYSVIPMVILIITVINMAERISVYRAYHQVQKAKKSVSSGKN